MKNRNENFKTESPEETQVLGEKIGKTLKQGDVIALIGDLGTGKTCLTQGIARGAGIAPDEIVSSPSYILINEYNGKVPIYHIDLYRLENSEEIAELGLSEYVEGDGICIIEWAERMADALPDSYIKIDITLADANILYSDDAGSQSILDSLEDENIRHIKIQYPISR
ncbi:tRNA (adenosine(37)-N6)-threonylcarbamoyltransferase complex ATPase subunit type 1 TsaE [Candidatus Poribacteria bacterium]|nr:tRNA (adenosine(37)-N6)-threonylcarbamoyltransferase complex ATPase subunit type 1 TsaE [Candidatus Poribacteria bacterium]MYG05069.1 tRNA (adenosine(37)-N6)-threonylcarbamoyltransferase complex ATPase subunit type 1 TsaE [Candidatus Poribacteria bacterium]MYK24558.1 tRNA (adenosine(37)-N6)-threonylcarbamoyltransferase complex ATPase subunit type 1 TsaE [Candidatus Poribacteria bacterium]